MNHSPGSWNVEVNDCSEGEIHWQEWSITSEAGPICAEVFTEANARLIATAPEMLNLVTRFRQWDMLDSVSDGPYWRSECDRVIAKAEGREP